MKGRTWGILSFLVIFFGMISCDGPTTVQEPDQVSPVQDAKIGSADLFFRPSCKNGVLSSGARYRICVPLFWNGQLVVYAPGYRDPNLRPLAIRDDEIGGFSVQEIMNNLGFAFATTSYHKNGLALPEALDDVVELVERTDQITRFRALEKAYLTGPSFGGLVTVMGIEKHSDIFSAALGACGPYGNFQWQINYLGDFRVVFDQLFAMDIDDWPIWKEPGRVEKDLIKRWEGWGRFDGFESRIRTAIINDMSSGGNKVKQLLDITSAPVDPGDIESTIVETVIDVLWYQIHGTNDAMEIMGGQPYDNINRDFGELLNPAVERFTADDIALAFIKEHYQTSGSLQRPLVTMHTIYDPEVPIEHLGFYSMKVQNTNFYRPVPVNRYGHCNFTLEEVLAAFAFMILKSTAQDLLVSTSVLPEPVQQQSFLTIARELGAFPKIVTPPELKKTMEPYEYIQ
jgi:hypothetical protein